VPDLSVVIPARDEAATVVDVISEHIAACDRLGLAVEVLVVDDRSRDGTFAVVERLAKRESRVQSWRHERPMGVEPTLLELYGRARGDWVYYVPADAQIPVEAFLLLWASRLGTECVVGRRTPRADPASRRFLAAAYSTLVRKLFGIEVLDIDSVKLMRGDRLHSLGIRSRSAFAEAELLVRLAQAGDRIREVPIPHRPRRAGRAHGAALRPMIATALDLARSVVALRRTPRAGVRVGSRSD
jgi:glycosyltransferase involved in cell wall biosynthesis